MLVESPWQWFNFNGHGGRGLIVIRNAHEQEAEVLAAIGLRAWRQATAALGITPTLYDNAASAFSNFTRDQGGGVWRLGCRMGGAGAFRRDDFRFLDRS